MIGVEKGIEVVSRAISDALRARQSVVVAVAGGSASGKTEFVAKRLVEKFGARLISQDDYYRGIAWMKANETEGRRFNFDQPEVFNLDLLTGQLQNLKAGLGVEKPVYDYKTGESSGSELVSPARVFVIEGLFALTGPMLGVADVKVFVDVSPHGRLIRRMMRDVKRTAWDAKDILAYALNVVEPMYAKYIQPQRANADIVVENDYDPAKEAGRAALREYQVKYRVESAGEAKVAIERLGGSLIAETKQSDSYYTASRDAVSHDEVVRIRRENGRTVFAYKGPKQKGALVRQRPSFVFELDEDVSKRLSEIYGLRVGVEKERTFYMLKGLVVTVDVVKSGSRSLGSFIEAQMFNPSQLQSLDELVKALGLGKPILESYFEIATAVG